MYTKNMHETTLNATQPHQFYNYKCSHTEKLNTNSKNQLLKTLYKIDEHEAMYTKNMHETTLNATQPHQFQTTVVVKTKLNTNSKTQLHSTNTNSIDPRCFGLWTEKHSQSNHYHPLTHTHTHSKVLDYSSSQNKTQH